MQKTDFLIPTSILQAFGMLDTSHFSDGALINAAAFKIESRKIYYCWKKNLDGRKTFHW